MSRGSCNSRSNRSGRRGVPIEFEGEPFHSHSAALWGLFRRRWEIATGVALELPEDA